MRCRFNGVDGKAALGLNQAGLENNLLETMLCGVCLILNCDFMSNVQEC